MLCIVNPLPDKSTIILRNIMVRFENSTHLHHPETLLGNKFKINNAARRYLTLNYELRTAR